VTLAALRSNGSGDTAVDGGTLRLYGPGDIDHLDPASAYYAPACEVVRLFSRQLVTYEPHPDVRNWQAIAPVPDVAVAVPSTYNAGLGASQRSYVLHLRPGVFWDTTPPRPVTAHDFVRGFKRMGNPVRRSPALAYFTSTVRGMAEFCAGFAVAAPTARPTAEELAGYQNANEIPGVFALDDQTLVIELIRPSPDFMNVLALTCASAAPVEYDAFVPASLEFRRNIRSNGPYRIAHYVPGKQLRLEPNPAWRRESDPVRHRHVDEIEIAVEKASAEEIAAKIDTRAADLPWAPPLCVPPDGGLVDPGAAVSYALDPYLVFNLAHGSDALRDVRVRQAIAAAIDKTAVTDIYRRCAPGVDVRVATSIVPPNNDGYTDGPGVAVPAHADPESSRRLLALAGYQSDLTLIAGYRDRGAELDVARSYAADLEEVGIVVRLVELDDDDNLSAAPPLAPSRAREWDITARSWSADWLYLNGRLFLQPLFETGASGNYGGYSNFEVDNLIRRALEAAVDPPATANAAWRDVERRVLDDVAVVPLLFRAPTVPRRRSARVRNALAIPAIGYAYDIATLWLDESGRLR
jgi:peptide/nickel transport system substrate-binding protein